MVPTYIVNNAEGRFALLVPNSPQSQLEGFSICGPDRKWVWADAVIDGADVIVWSANVLVPIAVRYGWVSNPNTNLYNGAGFLEAPPMRYHSTD
ncbi:MAG: hypothetical protein ABIT76_00865 [Chthoniobacterales bacterium]